MSPAYLCIEDPGHGWLKVPIEDVMEVGYKPTACSPKRRGFWYLEEDVDKHGFLDKRRARGFAEPRITTQHVEAFDR